MPITKFASKQRERALVLKLICPFISGRKLLGRNEVTEILKLERKKS